MSGGVCGAWFVLCCGVLWCAVLCCAVLCFALLLRLTARGPGCSQHALLVSTYASLHSSPACPPCAVSTWDVDGQSHPPVTPELLASFGIAPEAAGGRAAAPETLESMLLGVLPATSEGERLLRCCAAASCPCPLCWPVPTSRCQHACVAVAHICRPSPALPHPSHPPLSSAPPLLPADVSSDAPSEPDSEAYAEQLMQRADGKEEAQVGLARGGSFEGAGSKLQRVCQDEAKGVSAALLRSCAPGPRSASASAHVPLPHLPCPASVLPSLPSFLLFLRLPSLPRTL